MAQICAWQLPKDVFQQGPLLSSADLLTPMLTPLPCGARSVLQQKSVMIDWQAAQACHCVRTQWPHAQVPQVAARIRWVTGN